MGVCSACPRRGRRGKGPWPAVLVVALTLPTLASAAGGTPSKEAATGDFLGALVLSVLLAGALASLLRGPFRRDALILWVVKVGMTLAGMLLYEEHYAGRLDAFSYFESANPVNHRFHPDDLLNGTDFVITLTWLGRQAGLGYHAVKTLFSFIGLVGFLLWADAARRLWLELPPRAVLWVGLVPGILFWSSILGKEPLMLLALGLVAQGVAARRALQVPLVAAGILVAFLVRPWMALILGLPSIWWIAWQILSRLPTGTKGWGRRALWVATWGAVVLGVFWAAAGGAEGFRIDMNGTRSAENGLGGSSVDAPPFPDLRSMVAFWPWGAFGALYRPLPGEIVNPLFFGFAASLDGVLLLILTLRWARRGRWPDLRPNQTRWAIAVTLLWLLPYAYLSSLNLGTAARYRLQILPLVVTLLWWLGRPRVGPSGPLEPGKEPFQAPRHDG